MSLHYLLTVRVTFTMINTRTTRTIISTSSTTIIAKWEPKKCGRNTIGIYVQGSLYSTIFLLYSWGSLFGVPMKVP